MKKCSHCKETKSLFDFHKNKLNKDGLSYQCKQCRKAGCAAYIQKLTPEQKAYRNTFSARYKKENAEKVKVYAEHYRKTNKAKRAFLERKRQVSKKNRTPSWLTSFDLLKMECLYQVAAMRTRESGFMWHVDHVVPLQGKTVSGLHVPWNLQVIPANENLRKYNKYE